MGDISDKSITYFRFGKEIIWECVHIEKPVSGSGSFQEIAGVFKILITGFHFSTIRNLGFCHFFRKGAETKVGSVENFRTFMDSCCKSLSTFTQVSLR